MSLCVIIRSQNDVWVGSDTALSATIDGIKYRILGDYREKVFQHGNNVIFCSGLIYVSDLITKMIRETETIDIDSIQEYTRNLVKSLPSANDKYSETGVVICKANGEIVSMVQEQDFDIVVHKPLESDYVQSLTAGYDEVKARELVIEALYSNENIINAYGLTYSGVSSPCIGGNLILFHMSLVDNTIEKYIFEIIEPNKENYLYRYAKQPIVCESYFNGSIYANDFHFNDGGTVKTLLDSSTKQIGSEFLNLKGINVNDRFKIDMNGDATIVGGSISWSAISNPPTIPVLPNYIRSTYIDSVSVQSPNIIGGTITGGSIIGGSITSDTTIDIGTDARIGNNLHLKIPPSGKSGIYFGSSEIQNYGSIISDPVAGAMEIGYRNSGNTIKINQYGISFTGTINGLDTVARWA